MSSHGSWHRYSFISNIHKIAKIFLEALSQQTLSVCFPPLISSVVFLLSKAHMSLDKPPPLPVAFWYKVPT